VPDKSASTEASAERERILAIIKRLQVDCEDTAGRLLLQRLINQVNEETAKPDPIMTELGNEER
tara:strand:+ start:493 stop:684 length:192 start_codon:yes stop_codon:yes gene_type:complete